MARPFEDKIHPALRHCHEKEAVILDRNPHPAVEDFHEKEVVRVPKLAGVATDGRFDIAPELDPTWAAPEVCSYPWPQVHV